MATPCSPPVIVKLRGIYGKQNFVSSRLFSQDEQSSTASNGLNSKATGVLRVTYAIDHQNRARVAEQDEPISIAPNSSFDRVVVPL
jgi:hypothetical protein